MAPHTDIDIDVEERGGGLGWMLAPAAATGRPDSPAAAAAAAASADDDADEGACSRRSYPVTELAHGKEVVKSVAAGGACLFRMMVYGKTLAAVRVWSSAGAIRAFASFQSPEPSEAHHEFATGVLSMEDPPAELLVRGCSRRGPPRLPEPGRGLTGPGQRGLVGPPLRDGAVRGGGHPRHPRPLRPPLHPPPQPARPPARSPGPSQAARRPVRGVAVAAKREYLVACLPPAPLSAGAPQPRRVLLEAACSDAGCGATVYLSHDYPYPDAEHHFAAVRVGRAAATETAVELAPFVSTVHFAVEPLEPPACAHYTLSLRLPRRGSSLHIGWPVRRLAAFFRGLVASRRADAPEAAGPGAQGGQGQDEDETGEGGEQEAPPSPVSRRRSSGGCSVRRSSLAAGCEAASPGARRASESAAPAVERLSPHPPGGRPRSTAPGSRRSSLTPHPPAAPRRSLGEGRTDPRVAAAIAECVKTAAEAAEAAHRERALRRHSEKGPPFPARALLPALEGGGSPPEAGDGEAAEPLSARERRVTVASADLSEFRARMSAFRAMSGHRGHFPGPAGPASPPPLAPGPRFVLPRVDSLGRSPSASPSPVHANPALALLARGPGPATVTLEPAAPRSPRPGAFASEAAFSRSLPISAAILAGRRESIRFPHEEPAPHETRD